MTTLLLEYFHQNGLSSKVKIVHKAINWAYEILSLNFNLLIVFKILRDDDTKVLNSAFPYQGCAIKRHIWIVAADGFAFEMNAHGFLG